GKTHFLSGTLRRILVDIFPNNIVDFTFSKLDHSTVRIQSGAQAILDTTSGQQLLLTSSTIDNHGSLSIRGNPVLTGNDGHLLNRSAGMIRLETVDPKRVRNYTVVIEVELENAGLIHIDPKYNL